MDIRAGEIFCCPKVNEFDLELIVEEDVLRLEVAMHDFILIMQGADSLDYMHCKVLEDGLSNNTVKLGVFPKLSVGWAFHLQEEVELILEGLPKSHNIFAV